MRTLLGCFIALTIVSVAEAQIIDTIDLTTGADSFRVFWDVGNQKIAFQLNSASPFDIPRYVPNSYPTYYSTIQLVGGGGGDNFVVDESKGQLFSGGIIQSLEFDDGTGTNTLTMIGNGAGNTLIFAPSDSFSTPPNSFTIDSTLVTYNPNVQPPQFQLGGGTNTITVQGDSHYAESVKWNDSSFDPNENSNLSLTIASGGEVIFDRGGTSGAAIGSLIVAGGGEFAMLNVGLGEGSLVFGSSANLGGEFSMTLVPVICRQWGIR
jgi:hypothetical protein